MISISPSAFPAGLAQVIKIRLLSGKLAKTQPPRCRLGPVAGCAAFDQSRRELGLTASGIWHEVKPGRSRIARRNRRDEGGLRCKPLHVRRGGEVKRMAIYTTFFLCKPPELPGGFPGWRLPLAQPVRR